MASSPAVGRSALGTDVPEQLRATSSGVRNTSAQLGTAQLLLVAAAGLALVVAAGFARLRRAGDRSAPAR